MQKDTNRETALIPNAARRLWRDKKMAAKRNFFEGFDPYCDFLRRDGTTKHTMNAKEDAND
jgi:hypothetical protein